MCDLPGSRQAAADAVFAWRWFRGQPAISTRSKAHGDLVTLDHDDPEVVDHTRDVIAAASAVADGWQLDAAYAVPRQVLGPDFLQEFASFQPERIVHGKAGSQRFHGGRFRETGFDSVPGRAVEGGWHDLRRQFLWLTRRCSAQRFCRSPCSAHLHSRSTTSPRSPAQLQRPEHLAHALVILMTVGGSLFSPATSSATTVSGGAVRR